MEPVKMGAYELLLYKGKGCCILRSDDGIRPPTLTRVWYSGWAEVPEEEFFREGLRRSIRWLCCNSGPLKPEEDAVFVRFSDVVIDRLFERAEPWPIESRL